MTKTSFEESREEFRSSTVPNARRRIVTKRPLEENKSDERTVAVTIQESLDGIREKAMRSASFDDMGASGSARRGPSPGEAEIDKIKKAKEIVRVQQRKKGDIVVACASKSNLWKDVDLRRAVQNWNMRSPESALRVVNDCQIR